MRPEQIMKRAVDVCLALVVLTASIPVLGLAALLVWILEGRPIHYISRRYVSPHRSINVIKFRTMVRDAKSPKYRLSERFMRGGFLDIPRTCEVYTPIGRILERLQIVELPQVLNVLFHEMSFIGNRPLPYENLQLLQRYEGWQMRFGSPAGISGIAQIVGKLNLEPEERLALESAYCDVYRRGNLVLCDLLIMGFTIVTILRGTSISLEQAMGILEAAASNGLVKKLYADWFPWARDTET